MPSNFIFQDIYDPKYYRQIYLNFREIIEYEKGEIQDFNKITFQYSKKNNNSFCTLKCIQGVVFIGYEGEESEPGTDIGLIRLKHNQMMEQPSTPISQNSNWGKSFENSGAKEGSTIMVIGYPGKYKDQQVEGELIYQQGPIKKIEYINKLARIYYTLQTSEGQSGSPVYLLTGDKDKEKEWMIIGVHVEYNRINDINVATAITQKVLNWINNTITQKN